MMAALKFTGSTRQPVNNTSHLALVWYCNTGIDTVSIETVTQSSEL